MAEEINVDVVFQTLSGLAICVREDEDSDCDIWLPLSQITVMARLNDLERGDPVMIQAPEWLLERKGLI